MRLLVVFLTMLAMPAWATQDQWPATFDVTGVASNDVLNIRSAPSAKAEILGSFAPGAKDIEVIRPDDREAWGQVNVGEGTGWVSLRFLARQPGQWLGQFPAIRQCYGTEPFWSLGFMPDGRAIFETPEQTQTGGIIQTVPSEGRRDRHAVALRFDKGTWVDAVGFIRLDQCGDGMSDRTFGISIDLLLGAATGERVLSGCCSLAP